MDSLKKGKKINVIERLFTKEKTELREQEEMTNLAEKA
jgi:hypothetical protein